MMVEIGREREGGQGREGGREEEGGSFDICESLSTCTVEEFHSQWNHTSTQSLYFK